MVILLADLKDILENQEYRNQAIRMKEKGIAEEIVALSCGPPKSEETLRTALAMGMDRAIHVVIDDKQTATLEPLAVAKLFAKIAEQEKPDVILVGKQAIDDDCNQTAQMLSTLLNWSQATYASEIVPEDGKLKVTREIDGGLENISVKLPAVISADLRLNEPRYATLPNIMKAKKKKIDKKSPADLGVDVTPRIEILNVEDPPVRQAGIKIDNVDDLVGKMKDHGFV